MLFGLLPDPRSCGGDRWNALWRLCLHLRCAPDGCDAQWVKNPRAKRSRTLNWHQRNCQLLKMKQMKSVESRDRVRAGRLERWYEQGRRLRASFAKPLAEPNSLQFLKLHPMLTSVVLFFFRVFYSQCDVHVPLCSLCVFYPMGFRSGHVVLYVDEQQTICLGLVLTVWRIGKKRKPAPNPCPVNGCFCFRVVEATQQEDSLYFTVLFLHIFFNPFLPSCIPYSLYTDVSCQIS